MLPYSGSLTASTDGRLPMYRPIADYGLIGDSCSTALVSAQGAIDYCCMPDIDSAAVFSAILDDKIGGSFSLKPADPFTSAQTYIPGTAILKTRFVTAEGSAVVFDFFAKTGSDQHRIHRCVRGERGIVPFVLELSPRPDYARIVPEVSHRNGAIVFQSKVGSFAFKSACSGIEQINFGEGRINSRFIVDASSGAHFDFVSGAGPINDPCPFDVTAAFWKEWAESPGSGIAAEPGTMAELLNRSLITLKLLTYDPTGAFAGAATYGLPEAIGGSYNWDYRYSWVRDSAFALRAFDALRHHHEMHRYITWLLSVFKRHGSNNLRVLYSVRGEPDIPEQTLDHLSGYLGSRPVRIGNAASQEVQWDIFGEAVDALLHVSSVDRMEDALWTFCNAVCEQALAIWQSPDDGIWERRKGKRHFVYSKVMCWVAVDRCIKLSRKHGYAAPLEKWQSGRDQIKATVLEQGYDEKKRSFVSWFGSSEVDGSLLRIPLSGFLPADDPRIVGTIDRCIADLMESGFMRRYPLSAEHPNEGTFIVCNFWLIECLALLRRFDEAESILRKTLEAANPLGLFSEMYHPGKKLLLGNFPQAYSHFGFINAVQALKAAKAETAAPARL